MELRLRTRWKVSGFLREACRTAIVAPMRLSEFSCDGCCRASRKASRILASVNDCTWFVSSSCNRCPPPLPWRHRAMRPSARLLTFGDRKEAVCSTGRVSTGSVATLRWHDRNLRRADGSCLFVFVFIKKKTQTYELNSFIFSRHSRADVKGPSQCWS